MARKRPNVENEMVDDNLKETVGKKLLSRQSWMRTKDLQDLIKQQKMSVKSTHNPLLAVAPTTNLGRILGENPSEGFGRPI